MSKHFMKLICVFVALLCLPASATARPDNIQKESIAVQGNQRTYYLYVPEQIATSSPAPLIVLLHGSGGNGRGMIEAWKDFASKEGIVLVGPDALDGQHWSIPEDAPEFLYKAVEAVKARYPINARRVYLFGHSAGANGAIPVSLFESEYFTATVVSAGALRPERYGLTAYAKRKIPFALFVGIEDPYYPLTVVRATRDALVSQGFPVTLTVIPHHDHNYGARAKEINRMAWEFFEKQELKEDQRYTPYSSESSASAAPNPEQGSPDVSSASSTTPDGHTSIVESGPAKISHPPTLRGAATVGSATHEDKRAAATEEPKEVAEDEVVRVSTSLVRVPVSVMDRDGKYVTGLQAEDFRIYEDGVEQQIAYFAPVEKSFTVALLLDVSDSTRFRLADIQEAAISFVQQLRPDDRVIVIAFDKVVTPLSEVTNDREVLRYAIRRAATGGGTALYNAFDVTLKQILGRIQGRKAVVLFTDGVDTSSRGATFESNLRDAEESDVLAYTVQYPIGSAQGGAKFSMPVAVNSASIGLDGRLNIKRANEYLTRLAENTGGRHYPADGPQDLAAAFAHVAEELRRQYSLGFYTQASTNAGERRHLKVRVSRPKVIVRGRPSYIYNPPKEKSEGKDGIH